MRSGIFGLLLLAGLVVAARVQAQLVPFVGQGAALFAPQIDVVNSGTLSDVEATVSADRKYVTLTMRPQISNVVSMQTFAFQTTGNNPGGFVGNPQPVPAQGGAAQGGGAVQLPAVGGAAGNGGAAKIAPKARVNDPALVPVQPPAAPTVLSQPGITQISAL